MDKYVAIGGDPDFGCDGAALQINGTAQTIGFLQNCKKSNNSEKVEIKDSNGNTRIVVVHNRNGSLSASFALNADADLPEPGDTLTIGGVTALIETVEESWSNDAAKTADITATWYEGVNSTLVNTEAGA